MKDYTLFPPFSFCSRKKTLKLGNFSLPLWGSPVYYTFHKGLEKTPYEVIKGEFTKLKHELTQLETEPEKAEHQENLFKIKARRKDKPLSQKENIYAHREKLFHILYCLLIRKELEKFQKLVAAHNIDLNSYKDFTVYAFKNIVQIKLNIMGKSRFIHVFRTRPIHLLELAALCLKDTEAENTQSSSDTISFISYLCFTHGLAFDNKNAQLAKEYSYTYRVLFELKQALEESAENLIKKTPDWETLISEFFQKPEYQGFLTANDLAIREFLKCYKEYNTWAKSTETLVGEKVSLSPSTLKCSP